MPLPANKIKKVKLPNNIEYDIVPTMLQDGTTTNRLSVPTLSVDSTIALDSDVVKKYDSTQTSGLTDLASLYTLIGDEPAFVALGTDWWLCRVKSAGGTAYSFEMESLWGSGRVTSSHTEGSTLLSTILADNSTYSQPYALDSNVVKKYYASLSSSITTIERLYSYIGSDPCIGHFNPNSASWYLARISNPTSNVYLFEFEDLTGEARFIDTIGVGGSYLLTDIFSTGADNRAYKPHALNLSVMSSTTLEQLRTRSGGSAPFLFQYNGTNAYLGHIINSGGTYYFEFEYIGGSGGGISRFVGSTTNGSATLSTILDTSGSYYEPYALVEQLPQVKRFI